MSGPDTSTTQTLAKSDAIRAREIAAVDEMATYREAQATRHLARRGGATIAGLGKLAPETRVIPIQRGAETIYLEGYVDGNRVPHHVQNAVRGARSTYIEWLAANEAESHEPRLREQLDATGTLYADILMAVIPGLKYDEASVLAGRDEQRQAVLIELGWMSAPSETSSEPEVAPPGETEAATEVTS